jgi:hypothetical protein
MRHLQPLYEACATELVFARDAFSHARARLERLQTDAAHAWLARIHHRCTCVHVPHTYRITSRNFQCATGVVVTVCTTVVQIQNLQPSPNTGVTEQPCHHLPRHAAGLGMHTKP